MKRVYPFLQLDNITIRLYDKFFLPGTSWRIHRQEQWAVLGDNGSGKSTLVKSLAGELPVIAGCIRRQHPLAALSRVHYISFEAHKALIGKEQKREDLNYCSREYLPPNTVAGFLSGTPASPAAGETSPWAARCRPAKQHRRLPALFGLASLFNRPLKTLSTGEMRKVIICRALLQSPGLVILDEPFDGLDTAGRSHLSLLIRQCMQAGIQIILITHRFEELVEGITHVLWVKDGRVAAAGTRLRVLRQFRQYKRHLHRQAVFALPACYSSAGEAKRVQGQSQAQSPTGEQATAREPGLVLVDMRAVSVRYADVQVFTGLNWSVRRGEHWLVTGANGAGKSTLLSLITADNPQAYSNEIYLFGRLRGSGESIWEIKEQIGFVSAEFQLNYWQDSTLINVLLSGFFDSIGLYRKASAEQCQIARAWLAACGLAVKGETARLSRLSSGEQRLLLIARAMLKAPALLILDEPLQGLDSINRRRMLAFIEAIGYTTTTTLIYVTHYGQEVPACMTHTLHLQKNGYTIGTIR